MADQIQEWFQLRIVASNVGSDIVRIQAHPVEQNGIWVFEELETVDKVEADRVVQLHHSIDDRGVSDIAVILTNTLERRTQRSYRNLLHRAERPRPPDTTAHSYQDCHGNLQTSTSQKQTNFR